MASTWLWMADLLLAYIGHSGPSAVYILLYTRYNITGTQVFMMIIQSEPHILR